MPSGRTILLFLVVVVFGLALWTLLPLETERFGSSGIHFGLDLEGGVRLVYRADLTAVDPGTEDEVIDGVIGVIANRINPLGVTEPNIERRGADQIVVELPGTDISDAQKDRIGRTALLEFRELVEIPMDVGVVPDDVPIEADADAPADADASDEEPVTDQEPVDGEEPVADEEPVDGEEPVDADAPEEEEEPEPLTIAVWLPATGEIDGVEKVLTSSYFRENTRVETRGIANEVVLRFEWNDEGAILSEQITGRLVGKQLAIYEGSGEDAQPLLSADGRPIAPVVESVIRESGVITGLGFEVATELSSQLNAGRLPVPLDNIGELTVKPKLGADFIGLSLRAGLIGILVVMAFMIAYYRIPGVMASLALVFYGVVVLALFKVLGVTLTLAGIGGFVLSLGMAVDANVLIFERMKEELRAGRSLGPAIESGFNRAWTAIRDSNITTFIVCGILIWVGSSIAFGGSVQGFGVTLLIGVAVSMLTAIVVTRTLLRLFVGSGIGRSRRLFAPHPARPFAEKQDD